MALCLLALIGVAALGPALGAGFGLIDDHEILSFSPGALRDPQLQHPAGLVTQILVNDAAGGRFRPLYWVARYAEIRVLGANPTAWHAVYVGLGILAAAMFYLALCAAKVGGFHAFLAGVWLLVLPGVSSIWIRLGPQESLGTVLLLLAALACARGARLERSAGWDLLFALSLSAAALTKESFALVTPAMFGLRMLLFWQRHGRHGALSPHALVPGVAVLLAGLFATAIAFNVARLSGPTSYGGAFLDAAALSFDATTVVNLAVLALCGGITFPFLAIGALLDARRPRGWLSLSSWMMGAAVVVLAILPQLVLYRQHGGFAIDRYVVPAGLSVAAGVAAASSWSQSRGQRALAAGVTTFWVIILGFGAVRTWRDAELFRADTTQFVRMLEALEQVPIGSSIAVVADPVRDLEVSMSLPYHLAARGRPDLDTRVQLTDSADPHAPQLAAEFATTYFPGRLDVSELGCQHFAAIVLFVSEPQALQTLPCMQEGILHGQVFAQTVSPSHQLPPVISYLFPPTTVGYSVFMK